jgi:uncharacterized protein YraI
MKSQITKLLLLPMVASIGLFSVACSNAPSNPNANAGNTAANNGNVAVAAPANGAPVAQAPAQAPVQAQPVAQAPVQTQPVAQAPVQAPVMRPEASARPVSAPQGSTNGSRYFVQTQQGDPVNLRASNSTNAAVIGSLPYGTEVIMHLSDRNGEWAEVSAPGNKRGWVAMRFLSQEMAPTPVARAQSANPVGNSAMWVKTLDGDSVNIRSGPSLENSVIGSLNNGAKVFPIGTVGQWTEIDTGNGVGYVASQYLVQ